MPPPALHGELVRARLLDVVNRRFQVPLTVIVAGAGFGKSTLLAQAIRANHADPRGIDAWLSCEPADCDAGHLASAMVAALGQVSDRGEPIERVLDAVGRLAPIDVCIVIDDVHEVPPGSTAADLLGELVTKLPPHAHLVLAGRSGPPIPLDLRRAAGQVIDVGIDELAFTSTEVNALARSLCRDARRRARSRQVRRMAVARPPRPLGPRRLGATVPLGRGRRRSVRRRAASAARLGDARLGHGWRRELGGRIGRCRVRPTRCRPSRVPRRQRSAGESRR